ncbi:MAG: Hpt domain-containing protein [Lacunisphaera sp.]|nr:Hpt domain-containing protein [Lacunisphaera sp.]
MSDNPVLEPSAITNLRALSPDDPAFLQELITIYLEDTPQRLGDIETALAHNDGPTLIRAAHTIKGSSGNFGAARFARLALDIEAHGKAGDLTAAAAIVPGLKAEFAQVRAALLLLTGGA